MGCSSSQAQPVLGDPQHEVTITDTRYWHRVKSEEELISSRDAESYGSRKGERDRIQMEFRALLDYPIGRLCLLDYSKSDIAPFVETCLHGWLDIKAFNSMVAGPTQKTMALSVFKKYVNNSSLVLINERERLQMLMTKPEMLVSGVFDEVEEAFFMLLYDHLYLKFRTTPQYKLMCSTMRKKYNRVKQKDFLYHQLIGQGGFGLVCEVSKISTGARYAMKLQRKVHMIEVFGDEPWRADTEKRAFASCHHPFIVELFFAFQTESLAIMVISLGTGRDLSKVLRGSGPLMIDQVVFYGAEIVSALSYLHDKGLIYRDLKPGNVLLNLDGHIQLVDFGGVCDINGNNFPTEKDVNPMFTAGAVPAEEISGATLPLSQFWSDKSHSIPPPSEPPVHVLSARSRAQSDVNISVADITGGAGVGDVPLRDDNMLSISSSGPDYEKLRLRCKAPSSVLMRLKRKFYELSDATILRHLVASDDNYDVAVTRISECMMWRHATLTMTEIPKHQTVGPGCVAYVHGTDVEGHPLIIFTTRLQDLSTRDIDEMERWFIYLFELAIQQLPPHLEQFTILVNRLGMKQRADFEIGARMFPILDRYYPNRLHNLYMYPVSTAFRTILGLVRRVAGKFFENMVFVPSLDALREVIPDHFILKELGGSCSYEFDIADCPPPVVCEPYEYCLQNGLTTAPLNSHSQSHSSHSSVSGTTDKGSEVANHSSQIMLSGMVDSALYSMQENAGRSERANSIVGTYSYMAPEMMILMMRAPGFTHTGYTKAVDWWSLGVTMYRLLTGDYPFETDIPAPKTPEAALMEGANRYNVLFEKVNYDKLVANPDAIDCISQLLTVDDTLRLGYGPEGSNAVSSHKLFRNINWIELEKKASKPPPIPESCAPHRAWREPTTLEGVLHLYRRSEWLDPPKKTGRTKEQIDREDALNAQLEFWDYTSPTAVLAELEKAPTAGDAVVMNKLEKKK